jgi:hypothetical protein
MPFGVFIGCLQFRVKLLDAVRAQAVGECPAGGGCRAVTTVSLGTIDSKHKHKGSARAMGCSPHAGVGRISPEKPAGRDSMSRQGSRMVPLNQAGGPTRSTAENTKNTSRTMQDSARVRAGSHSSSDLSACISGQASFLYSCLPYRLRAFPPFDVGRWMFDVRCSSILHLQSSILFGCGSAAFFAVKSSLALDSRPSTLDLGCGYAAPGSLRLRLSVQHFSYFERQGNR